MGARFWIGEEDNPFERQITITLHGAVDDVQLPTMGNKVLGCNDCQLDIHGTAPSHVYTLLSVTADEGDTIIEVDDAIDWQIGQEIVITSSHWDHL
jgi:hypothetical protein